MRGQRALWRGGEVAAQPMHLPVVRVVAPVWQDAQHRERDAGSFRLSMVAISLPGIPGTGETTRERPWRRIALNRGRSSL